jgi:hypothetical protein
MRYLWNVYVSLVQTVAVLSDLSLGLYHKSWCYNYYVIGIKPGTKKRKSRWIYESESQGEVRHTFCKGWGGGALHFIRTFSGFARSSGRSSIEIKTWEVVTWNKDHRFFILFANVKVNNLVFRTQGLIKLRWAEWEACSSSSALGNHIYVCLILEEKPR